MISYALIANGIHNPFLDTPLPEHMIYPISQNCPSGIDLDYSALVLGEQFIIDESTYNEVLYSRREYLNPMKYSLQELEASGLLIKKNYGEFFRQNKNKIIQLTNTLLQDVEKWLLLEQVQWKTLKGELLLFQQNYGSHEMRNINVSNIGIESWLSRSDQIYNEKLRKSLYSLFDDKITINDIDIRDVKGALQFIVAQIVMSDLVSHNLQCPVLDWDDSKNMYESLYKIMWDNYAKDNNLEIESKKLFSIVLPDLKPDNILSVIRFINNDKAVYSLREMLIELISSGQEVNKDWMNQYINKMFAADLVNQKKSSILQFFGTLIGIFSGTWVQGAAIAGGTTLADKLLNPKEEKYEWYYALQNYKSK